MSHLLHRVTAPNCLTAGELKDCLGATLMPLMNCRGAAWFLHFLFSEIFFFFFLGSGARLHTAAGWCLGESPQPSFFSDEIRGNRQAAQGRPHILLLLFFFFFFLLLYSIILSDRPPPLSTDSRASFQLASGKGGPLVCRHAGGNWIIPEIWASTQMESVIKAERRSNIDTDESCDVEIQRVSQQNKIFFSHKSGAPKELMMLLSWSF